MFLGTTCCKARGGGDKGGKGARLVSQAMVIATGVLLRSDSQPSLSLRRELGGWSRAVNTGRTRLSTGQAEGSARYPIH